MADLVFADLPRAESSIPTGRLRWSKSGELQQEWRIDIYYSNYVIADRKYEWRVVPMEGEE